MEDHACRRRSDICAFLLPVFFMKLLDYVAIYGLILMPMGAIVLVEHWVLPRIGVEQYATERRRAAFNWNALLVWIGTLAVSMVLPDAPVLPLAALLLCRR